MPDILLGGVNQSALFMDAAMANRHGLIAGATGTGKTVTLQVLAEGFSDIGVPVFLADVKGDLSGLAAAGAVTEALAARAVQVGLGDYRPAGKPAVFWDIAGENGHPVRTTISDLGPLLLGNLLELNDTQTGLLYGCFSLADDEGLLLLDLDDLNALLTWMGRESKALQADYGNITSASLGAIKRQLLVLEEQGAGRFFGEPALNAQDLLRRDPSGRGLINIFDAARLITSAPRVYGAFLLWLLAELYENLPEAGDADRPKLVLFFDEAHLLFKQAPKALLDKIEQIVRLIRSKGVGVYFISQSPLDIPQSILGQLGLKIQHALRAFTPKDQQVVREVAASFRANPAIDTETAIQELQKGEALVSVLAQDGSPEPVERILIRPPASRIGPLSASVRADIISRSPYYGHYEQAVNRESAYELLTRKAERQSRAEADPANYKKAGGRVSGRRQSAGEALVNSAARSIGSALGRQIVRGLLGSLLGGGRR